MVILVVFGDFSVFSVIFVVIFVSYLSYFFMAHRQFRCAIKIFFTQILFTPGGNFGPNCRARCTRLVVENGFFRKK